MKFSVTDDEEVLIHGDDVTTTSITLSNNVARRALAVGFTPSGGSVTGCLDDVRRCPVGRWPQTVQALRRLEDAVDLAARPDADELGPAVDDLLRSAGLAAYI